MCVSRAPKRRSGGQSLREGFFVCVCQEELRVLHILSSHHQRQFSIREVTISLTYLKKISESLMFFETLKLIKNSSFMFYAATLQFPFSPYSKRSCTISMNKTLIKASQIKYIYFQTSLYHLFFTPNIYTIYSLWNSRHLQPKNYSTQYFYTLNIKWSHIEFAIQIMILKKNVLDIFEKISLFCISIYLCNVYYPNNSYYLDLANWPLSNKDLGQIQKKS